MSLTVNLITRSSLAILLLVCVPAASEEVRTLSDVEQQILDTSLQLEALDEDILKSRTVKNDLLKAIKEAESRASERENRLQGLEREIDAYSQTLRALESQLAEAEAGLANQRSALGQALRDAQVIGQQSGLKIVLQNDDPALADRLSVYTEYIVAAQRLTINRSVEQLQQIDAARSVALKDRNWLNYIKKKASKQKEEFISEANQSQLSLSEVEAGLDEKTRTVAQLRADQDRLQTLMEELKALQSSQSGYFAAGKGDYPAPVPGTITARYNDVKSVGKQRWSGLFIKTRAGLPVKAVADGEVVYSNWLQGFGNLVIIDHGDNYTSLYGGNRDVTVPTGQWVESGATIATVGDSGGQNSSGVYFEIRHNAQAENPEDWLRPDSGLQNAGQ